MFSDVNETCKQTLQLAKTAYSTGQFENLKVWKALVIKLR